MSNALSLERSQDSNIGDRVWQSLDMAGGNRGGGRNGLFFGGKFGQELKRGEDQYEKRG